jgi:hypothetical protein
VTTGEWSRVDLRDRGAHGHHIRNLVLYMSGKRPISVSSPIHAAED